MSCKWESPSRYDSPRHFVFDGKDQITVTCHDVLYTSFTDGKNGVLSAVDPDGGPYLGVNSKVGTMNRMFRILDIVSYKNRGHLLVVVLRVEEENKQNTDGMPE